MTGDCIVFRSARALTRRRLVQGAAALGALTSVPWASHSAHAAPGRAPVLSGTEFELEIAFGSHRAFYKSCRA